jgi:hypothetical protein
VTRSLVVLGFEGSQAAAAALQGALGASGVERFARAREALASLAGGGAEFLLVEAEALRPAEAEELRALLAGRPALRAVFAFEREGEVTLHLRAAGALGLRKPLLVEDLEAVGRLAGERGGPHAGSENGEVLAARFATEIRGIARVLVPSGAPVPSPAAARAAARELLDLAARLDAMAADKGSLPTLPRERFDLRDLLDQRIAALQEESGAGRRLRLRGERGVLVEAPRVPFERACGELLSFAGALSLPEGSVEVAVEPGNPPRFEVSVAPAPGAESLEPADLDEFASSVDGGGTRLLAFQGFCQALGWSCSLARDPGGPLRVAILAGRSS